MVVYLLNGVANMAAADEDLGDLLGKHGACKAVVSVLEEHPRDLQLQASGVKAVRSLALSGGRNVEVLAAVRGPVAVARAQGLFLRDREVQLACLGAVEILCRSGSQANKMALANAGSLTLLESALDQFADDAELVAQGLCALVEMMLSVGVDAGSPAETAATGVARSARWCVDGVAQQDGDNQRTVLPMPSTEHQDLTADAPDASRAVGTVLAAMERNPCREVCLSAFDALGRLLGIVDAANSVVVGVDAGGDRHQCGGSIAVAKATDARLDGDVITRGMLLWAKVGYAVKRALKLNRGDDAVLSSSGGKILALVAVARGRALAQ